MLTKWYAAAVVITLAACGAPAEAGNETVGGSETESTTTTGAETEDAVPSPPKPWSEMSMGEKRQWMGREVMPRMAALFEAHDAERYGGFGCETCHGADMVDREFAMPSDAIMALHPTGSEEQTQMVQDHPDTVRFMFNDVLPTMQTLLGAPGYDQSTGEGFSCYACHPRAGDDAEAGDDESATAEGDESAFALPAAPGRL